MSDSNNNNTAEVEIMVASLVEVFYDQNGDRNVTPTAKLQTCCKTLRILIQNAVTKPAEDRYRQVRLDNAKIQERVANVPGAVDLLQSAGFCRSDDQTLLQYAPEDAAQAAQVGRALVAALDLKLQQLQRAVAVSSKQQQTPTATSSQQPQQSPFLSEEERQRRYLRAKQLRKQRAAERDLTKQRFREDQQDRTERLKNQERAKRAAAAAAAEATTDSAVGPPVNDNEEGGMQVAPAGVFIRRHQPNAAATAADGEVKHTPPQRLPTPMEPAASARTPPLAPAAAAAVAAQARAAGGGGMTTTTTPPSAATAAAAASLDDAMETDAAVTKKQRLFDESSSSSPAAAADAATDSMDVEDQKLPAKPSAATSETEDAAAVAAYLKRLPRCGAAAGIRDTSTYRHQASSLGSASAQRPACLKKLLRELKELDENLPSQPAIWVRFDEEQPQFLRALIVAPTGTPYAHGLFAFDVYLPDRYPAVPPNVQLLTTGGGTVRFGPNLYANGKCCLSLLGTWPGPKWNPLHSSLFQVLVSIQGLILGVEHPYYLEPGHGGWEGNVKAEGEFAMTGQMLSTGKVVRTEIGVPPEIVDYDNRLRVGTVRYAMLDTLQGAAAAQANAGGDKSSILGKHLSMFQPVIAAHFYHSRQAIVEETQQWLSTAAAAAAGTKAPSSTAPSNVVMLDPSMSSSAATTHQELVKCVAKLQDKLSHLTPPPEAALKDNDEDETMETVDNAAPAAESAPAKPAPTAAAAAPKPPPSRQSKDEQKKETTAMDVEDTDGGEESSAGGVVALIAKKQREMEQAAARGDYVAAGKLQTEVQHLQESKTQLQDLERRMAQAAAAQDFIKAGRFQEQYQALLDAGGDAATTSNNNMMWDQGEGVPGGGGGDFDDDDDSDMGGGPPFAAGAPAGFPGAMGGQHHLAAAVAKGKHVFAPPGVRLNSGAAKNHTWGSGSALLPQAAEAPQQGNDNDDNDSTTAEGLKPAAAAVKKAPIPPERLCRLKFRLPEKSRTVLEAFDQNDPLSTVYTFLETLVVPGPSSSSAPQGDSATTGAASMPPPVNARFGAFSQPLSSAGFTLLLSHPKREFNLEMHGTKTLEELNLAPSATLTVMRCHERGVVHRGELQSRLDQAEGGAMDLDGLTYEGLMELTERVGNAAPPQGAVSLTLSQHDLDANSVLLSPCSLLLSPGAAALSEEEQKCPICLGQYAAEDESPGLRKLKACGHVFHDSCLTTWLRSKSSCPLCKADIVVVDAK